MIHVALTILCQIVRHNKERAAGIQAIAGVQTLGLSKKPERDLWLARERFDQFAFTRNFRDWPGIIATSGPRIAV